MYAV
jgi:hypothetical protein